MSVGEIALIVPGVVIALPVLVLFLQIAAALKPDRARGDPATQRPKLAVVIPAHDERSAIERTIASIAPQLAKGDRLVVVADNCSDDTAAVARRAGAEVTERSDAGKRGKGYALAHGLKYLERTGAPEVVVFVDADCQAMESCIGCLGRAAVHWKRPIQAAYMMSPPKPPHRTASIVSFAWRVKDFVRPLGWSMLGLPCQLAGSGMAFPWNVVRMVDLASDHLVEDVKQGLDLGMIGYFPRFCPEAVVTSKVFTGHAPAQSQRARWEHGMLQLMLDYAPRLFARFLKAPSASLAAMTFDILIPPLALLALALGGYFAAGLLLLLLGGGAVPLILSLALSAVFAATIVLAWWGHGQDILPLRWLVFAPFYALGKLPLYAKFLVARQRTWVRGEREAH
jgi:cellulose synthase/poly-beta-1,6-N-acetylglucosamine synthase-like glycosyltransferase